MSQDLKEDGFSIMEVLVGLLLLSMMGLGLTMSTTMATRTRGVTVRDSAAMQIAMEALENLSSSDPTGLDNNDDSTTSIERAGNVYSRQIDVTVNADHTRTVAITVTGAQASLGGSVSLSETLIPWTDS